MSDTNTGGPAFPHGYTHSDYSGMTLRDYFAAKAMQADMTGGLGESDFVWIAGRAYAMADAMLKAREV